MSRKSRNNRKKREKEKTLATQEEVLEEKDELELSVEEPIVEESKALSFEELEDERLIKKEREKASDLVVDAQMLMTNIMLSEVEPQEKAKSIASVGETLASRFASFFPKEEKEQEFDFDLAFIKMLLKQSEGSAIEKITASVKSYKEDYPLMDKAAVRYTLSKLAKEIEAGEKIGSDWLEEIYETGKAFGIGVPSKEETSSLIITKDKEGAWRWFGVVSNNFKDRDGEIISDEAHKEYVAWLDEKPQLAPTFRSWHVPGTDRKAQADWWGYENGFLMMSGVLEEKEAQGLLTVASKNKLGMSHGFFARKEDNVITKYRSFEVSDLPQKYAANPWTTLEAIQKEVADMSKNKLGYLSDVLGEDFTAEVEEITAEKQEELRDLGVEEKETKTEEKEETKEQPEGLDVVLEAISKELGFDDLSEWVKEASEALEKLPVLEAKITELEKSEDEKIAEQITPPIAKSRYSWSKRLSQSEDTEVDEKEDEEILKDVPTSGWFTEAVKGTTE